MSIWRIKSDLHRTTPLRLGTSPWGLDCTVATWPRVAIRNHLKIRWEKDPGRNRNRDRKASQKMARNCYGDHHRRGSNREIVKDPHLDRNREPRPHKLHLTGPCFTRKSHRKIRCQISSWKKSFTNTGRPKVRLRYLRNPGGLDHPGAWSTKERDPKIEVVLDRGRESEGPISASEARGQNRRGLIIMVHKKCH